MLGREDLEGKTWKSLRVKAWMGIFGRVEIVRLLAISRASPDYLFYWKIS